MRTLQNSELLQVCGGSGGGGSTSAPSSTTVAGPISIGNLGYTGQSGVNVSGSFGNSNLGATWSSSSGLSAGAQYHFTWGGGDTGTITFTSNGKTYTVTVKVTFN